MTTLPAFLDFVKDDIQAVEDLMRAQSKGYTPDLESAFQTMVASGGKRIRPAIVLLAGKMLGAPENKLITMGAAIEMLHTATLVHDDLVDNALLRRGTPTLNSKWGPGATVLTGDFLFARAAHLAAEVGSVPILQVFAKTLTIIVNGEISQYFHRRFLVNRSEYYQRIYAKTASLFETCTQTAAMLSPVDPETIEVMRHFGYEIGMAFQIIDDILDFTSQQTMLGKPVGGDLRYGIVTLPALYYIETNPDDEDVKRLICDDCPKDEKQINRMIESIRNSDAIRLAHDEAVQHVQRGLTYLEKQPQCVQNQMLGELAHYVVRRES